MIADLSRFTKIGVLVELAKKMWEKERETGQSFSDEAGKFTTKCDCCGTYKERTVRHKPLAKRLTVVASKPFHYTIFPPNESVTIVQNGEQIQQEQFEP